MLCSRQPLAHRILATLTTVFTVIAVNVLIAPPAAHAAITRTVKPGYDLAPIFERLRAGDTLLFSPGTYDIGTLRPTLASATADSRITVKALDPARKPLLRGWLRLERPNYWTISGLRVQATLSRHEAIDVFGGRFWSIQDSEVFGARQTGAFANIAVFTWDDPADPTICGATPAAGCENPYGWSILTSCVHDAGLANAPGHNPGNDHNIYLSGAGYAPGRISRNILYNAQYGSQIKLGSPNLYSGFTSVAIDHNTMQASGEGVLVTGNAITRTYVRYNLMKSMSPATTGVGAAVYLDAPGRALQAGETPNYVLHNYGAGIKTSTLYRSYNALNYPGTYQQVDNPTLNGAVSDPRFNAGGCSGFRPANPTAARYGRYGTFFGTGF